MCGCPNARENYPTDSYATPSLCASPQPAGCGDHGHIFPRPALATREFELVDALPVAVSAPRVCHSPRTAIRRQLTVRSGVSRAHRGTVDPGSDHRPPSSTSRPGRVSLMLTLVIGRPSLSGKPVSGHSQPIIRPLVHFTQTTMHHSRLHPVVTAATIQRTRMFDPPPGGVLWPRRSPTCRKTIGRRFATCGVISFRTQSPLYRKVASGER